MLACLLCDLLGIKTCIARKPNTFVIFQGGGGQDPLPPHLDPHMLRLMSVLLLLINCVLLLPLLWGLYVRFFLCYMFALLLYSVLFSFAILLMGKERELIALF